MDSPRLKSGYAYRSTKRFPAEPEIVAISPETLQAESFVGTAVVDGVTVNAFRVRSDQSNWSYYLFQKR